MLVNLSSQISKLGFLTLPYIREFIYDLSIQEEATFSEEMGQRTHVKREEGETQEETMMIIKRLQEDKDLVIIQMMKFTSILEMNTLMII